MSNRSQCWSTYSGRYELQEGDCDSGNAHEVFTSGHCHSLALAIHRLTGWPMYGFAYVGDDEFPGSHLVVKAPDQQYLDIEGPDALARYSRSWEGRPMVTAVCLEDFQEGRLRGYLTEDPDRAKPYALAVLEKHYPTWKKQRITKMKQRAAAAGR